jgi:Cytochrome c oxidase assembly protein COX16
MERRAGRRASSLLHAGGPLVALVVLGSLGLSHLIQGRKDVQDARRSADDVRLPAAVQMRKGRLDLEAEAEVRRS